MRSDSLERAKTASTMADAAIVEAKRLRQQLRQELDKLRQHRDEMRIDKAAIQAIARSHRAAIRRGYARSSW
jgi:hypothetical protein